MKSQALKEILREFDQSKQNAERAVQMRYDAMLDAVPRIKEIDDALNTIQIDIARQILKQPNINPSELKAQTTALIAEKQALMHLSGFNDLYFTQDCKCIACKDTGFIDNKKCACLNQRLIEKYYEMSNLSHTLNKENFEAFDSSFYSEEIDPNTGISPYSNIMRIYGQVEDFVRDFDTSFDNLLMHGPPGLGKTFMSNCIAKALLDRGKTVLYITATQLFKVVEELRFHRDETIESDTMLDFVTSADLLIIDDLGTEFSTVLTISELFNFINTRLLNRKSTIISTNIDPVELEKHYSDRLTSRIFGEYIQLKFIGDDIRHIKKYNRSV